MSTEHESILRFIQKLVSHKGRAMEARIEAEMWTPGQQSRSAFNNRGFCNPADYDIAPERPAYLASDSEPDYYKDGVLIIGQNLRLTVNSPRDGWLHLFNLGTSGVCETLSSEPLQVYKGEPKGIPDEDPNQGYPVLPPTSGQHGQPERLLVLVTDSDYALSLQDLDPDLRHQTGTRGTFAAPPTTERPRLFRLPLDTWDYCLLEWETRAS